ncbi:MAG: hypothetical protein ACI8V2_003258 [Candidatus Latescibacterota bacterium]
MIGSSFRHIKFRATPKKAGILAQGAFLEDIVSLKQPQRVGILSQNAKKRSVSKSLSADFL